MPPLVQDTIGGGGAPFPGAVRIPDQAIRDTMEAVFRQPGFARQRPSWFGSLADRFWQWFWDLLRSIFGPLFDTRTHDPVLFWLMAGLFALIVGAIIGRLAWVSWQRRKRGIDSRPAFPVGGSPRFAGDPWLAAQRLAADGNFTDAAHALYLALLEATARRGGVKLHPSKTAGDYVRELRLRPSALFGRFRDFARAYEHVVYGAGHCDRERYERLHELALPIVQADG